jgi:hypothetical protein
MDCAVQIDPEFVVAIIDPPEGEMPVPDAKQVDAAGHERPNI